MSKFNDEQKLEALGLMESGEDLKDLVTNLGIGYATLLKWRTELRDAKETGAIQDLVNVDEVIVHRIAHETRQELCELVADDADVAEITKAVGEVTASIDTFQLLNTNVQTAALKIVKRINELAEDAPGSGELKFLTETLAMIQTSFFNSKSNIVNVNQINNQVSNTQVNSFKDLKRD